MNYDLIKSLLNLARNSDNDHEAALALSKATSIAEKAGVDLAVLEVRMGVEQVREDFNREEVTFGNRIPTVQKFVSWLLNDVFNVNVVYAGGRGWGRRMSILGRKSDVEFAAYANSFLSEEFERRWKYYQKPSRLKNIFAE